MNNNRTVREADIYYTSVRHLVALSMNLLIKTFPTSTKMIPSLKMGKAQQRYHMVPDLTKYGCGLEAPDSKEAPSKAFPVVVNGRTHALYTEALDCARRQRDKLFARVA